MVISGSNEQEWKLDVSRCAFVSKRIAPVPAIHYCNLDILRCYSLMVRARGLSPYKTHDLLRLVNTGKVDMAQKSALAAPAIMAVAGVILLISGFYLQFSASGVSSADQLRCEQNVKNLYKDSVEAQKTLISSCNEPGVVAMMEAKANGSGASEAAAAIASANQAEVGSGALGYGLIGVGAALLISGLFGLSRARKSV